MTPSGRIGLSHARAEVGASGRVGLLATNAIKLLAGNPPGRYGLLALRNATWINQNNYPNPNDYPTPDNATARVVLAPGVVITGNTSGVYSLFVGVGLNGNVTFDNYGTIEGAGGAPNGGTGGNALHTYCGTNTEAGRHGTLTVRNYGSILAGGGGGGGGGHGGAGGAGYYVATAQEGNADTYSMYHTQWSTSDGYDRANNPLHSANARWSDVSVANTDINAGSVASGSYTYYRGNYRNQTRVIFNGETDSSPGYTTNYYGIYRTYTYNVATSGGAGGAGGAGGWGQGFDHAAATGSGGAGGASPGTNAGWGGAGGTGGWGGGWGAAGAAGNAGSAGGNGNNGGGGAGTAGAGGGPPGYWFYNPAGDVTMTLEVNTGTIMGR